MFCKMDYRYFGKARQVAGVSDYRRVHIGCVAVYQSQIIGIGCNCNKTHPTQKFYNQYRAHSDGLLPKLHAEINCLNQIRHFDINFSKVKLYIYRIRNDQEFGLARPCPSCMAAIRDLGIREIYYTTNDGYSYEKNRKRWEGCLVCEICGTTPCVAGCPNYIPRKSYSCCCVCGDGIFAGEEYIENVDGEYMHVDCIQEIRQLLDWLGCEIKIKDDEDYGGMWFGDYWED